MPKQDNCEKIKYITQKNAEENIKIFTSVRSLKKKRKNGKLTCYHCDKCDGWHLTTIPKNVQRKIDKKYQLRDEYLRNKK